MNKKFYIALFFSLLISTKEAFAIYDFMAKVQSGMELKTEIETKVQEYRKQLEDMQKKLTQGFSAITSCFSNPLNCDIAAFSGYFDANKDDITMVKEIPVMENATLMQSANLSEVNTESLNEEVDNAYVYQRAQGKDLGNANTYRKNINNVISQEAEILFAKGMVSRHMIQDENNPYPSEFTQNNIDEILKAHDTVEIMIMSRLARIVELRAQMVGAEATSELTTQSNDPNDKED